MMMGATKKKRGPQQGYVQGILDETVQMIRTGRMSVQKALILYQIPKLTLSDIPVAVQWRKGRGLNHTCQRMVKTRSYIGQQKWHA